MSALALRDRPWPVYAVLALVALATIGMFVTGALHAQIGKSAWLDGTAAASFLAALAGAIGALILANTRRNVMWILGVAVAMSVLLGVLAIVLSELAG